MGRLGCKCGKVLSNVDCPTDVELWGFEETAITNLIKSNPDLILTDAVMDYSMQDYYFWYCRDCGRVYVFRTDHQMYKSIYLRQEYGENVDIADILNLCELYFFTDRQVEEPTERDFGYTLKAFLDNPPHPYRFFITCDSSKVYAYNATTGSVAYCYVLESEHNDEVSAEV
jgi:hypothetical protein